MRRFSIKAVVGCCALVVLLIGIWSPWNPSYQGVRLTAWIEELDHAYDTSFFAYTPYIPTQAVHALQCLSSSATPRFLRMLKQEDSAFLSQANGMLEKQPVIRWRFPGHDQDHARALLGFCALGESGAPAIPELTRLLDDSRAAERAIIALGSIRRPAIPALRTALSHTNVAVRRGALVGLAEIEPAMPEALSASFPLVLDADADTRRAAVWVMSRYTNEIDLVWPVFEPTLHDPDIKVRRSALRSLKYFGHRAEPVLAGLCEQLRTTDSPSDFSAIAEGLKEMTPFDLPIADCLSQGLLSQHERHRIIAARTLRLLGRSASNAMPMMKSLYSQAAAGTYRDELGKALVGIAGSLGVDSGVDTNTLSRLQPARGRRPGR